MQCNTPHRTTTWTTRLVRVPASRLSTSERAHNLLDAASPRQQTGCLNNKAHSVDCLPQWRATEYCWGLTTGSVSSTYARLLRLLSLSFACGTSAILAAKEGPLLSPPAQDPNPDMLLLFFLVLTCDAQLRVSVGSRIWGCQGCDQHQALVLDTRPSCLRNEYSRG